MNAAATVIIRTAPTFEPTVVLVLPARCFHPEQIWASEGPQECGPFAIRHPLARTTRPKFGNARLNYTPKHGVRSAPINGHRLRGAARHCSPKRRRARKVMPTRYLAETNKYLAQDQMSHLGLIDGRAADPSVNDYEGNMRKNGGQT